MEAFEHESEFQEINENSFKELFKYPKTERYNKSDLITNPKEIKPLLEYLQKPGNTDKKMFIIKKLNSL